MTQLAEQDIARINWYFSHYELAQVLPNAHSRYMHYARESAFVEMLCRAGKGSLHDLDILDFGCGTGAVSRRLVELGANPSRLIGVDITSKRIDTARSKCDRIRFEHVDSQLPFDNSSFDLIFAFTVFSSMLDSDLRANAASELWRLLRPDGSIVWFDFVWNPSNPNTRGITQRELRSLFPHANIMSRRAILAPPLSRLALKCGILVHAAAESIPFLRSHRVAIVTKEAI